MRHLITFKLPSHNSYPCHRYHQYTPLEYYLIPHNHHCLPALYILRKGPYLNTSWQIDHDHNTCKSSNYNRFGTFCNNFFTFNIAILSHNRIVGLGPIRVPPPSLRLLLFLNLRAKLPPWFHLTFNSKAQWKVCSKVLS